MVLAWYIDFNYILSYFRIYIGIYFNSVNEIQLSCVLVYQYLRTRLPLSENEYKFYLFKMHDYRIHILAVQGIVLIFYIRNMEFLFMNTKKYHVFASMGRFQLESIYLYFPPSSQLVCLCFCPVGLSLL